MMEYLLLVAGVVIAALVGRYVYRKLKDRDEGYWNDFQHAVAGKKLKKPK